MKRRRAAHPDTAVEVWAEDEARLGRKPTVRRLWRRRGTRPTSCGRTKYEWPYLYAFVRPAAGASFPALQPRVKAERMGEALAAFAAHADPDGTKVRVLIADNAGRHRAKTSAVPANARLHFPPPSTPESQPVEALWPRVREAVANDTFDRLGQLRRRVRRRCRWLAANRDIVRGAVGFRGAARLEK